MYADWIYAKIYIFHLIYWFYRSMQKMKFIVVFLKVLGLGANLRCIFSNVSIAISCIDFTGMHQKCEYNVILSFCLVFCIEWILVVSAMYADLIYIKIYVSHLIQLFYRLISKSWMHWCFSSCARARNNIWMYF